MKKFVSSLLAAIMLLALALPVSAFAGENAQVELTAEGDRAAVRLQLPANTGKGITALQLTFQVTAPADAQLDFDFADDLPGSVQQVRYQAQQGTLTIYVAGTAQLFSQDQAYLGQLVASGDQEGDVVVKVEQNALRLVNGVNVASRPETAPAETQLTVETPTQPEPPVEGPDEPEEPENPEQPGEGSSSSGAGSSSASSSTASSSGQNTAQGGSDAVSSSQSGSGSKRPGQSSSSASGSSSQSGSESQSSESSSSESQSASSAPASSAASSSSSAAASDSSSSGLVWGVVGLVVIAGAAAAVVLLRRRKQNPLPFAFAPGAFGCLFLKAPGLFAFAICLFIQCREAFLCKMRRFILLSPCTAGGICYNRAY